ncbi:HemK/PrmC family methyltransferase [Schaalia sp. ZJ1691]|uniref:N5-glutamine methyltransferase family protein n=1 Tax=Schaalia sp. ZJ1691 TaxID=2709404 RepID=UPI0013ED4D42|nr:HemK/PrmC family methyltransferase [Schaalia sp. ZJ1691]
MAEQRTFVGDGQPDEDDNPGTTVASLLRWARIQLNAIGEVNGHIEARELLEWAAQTSSTWSIPQPVDADVIHRFIDGVHRRCARVPLQHITGRMYFRSLTLRSAPGVFVVRPETESVAGAAIDHLRAINATTTRTSLNEDAEQSPIVVDLCTGSGAIALAVATEVPGSRVYAVELDPDAVGLARVNVDRLAPGGVRVVPGDATDAQVLSELNGLVDVVVSNPPYVPPCEAPTQPEAAADPALALYGGGEDGMDVPTAILRRARDFLAPGGLVVVEHSPSQSPLMRHAARKLGFVDITTQRDLGGTERFLRARAPRSGDCAVVLSDETAAVSSGHAVRSERILP